MNYKEKYEQEKRKNKFLIIALIILSLSFIFVSIELEMTKIQAEDLCYINHRMTDLINDMKEMLEIDVEDISSLDCYSGQAERRLNG